MSQDKLESYLSFILYKRNEHYSNPVM